MKNSNPRSSSELTNIIIEKKEKIFNTLQKESIDVYRYLMNLFYNSEDISNNNVFKFLYRSFYRLDNAGLSDDFKNEYFILLNQYKNEINYNYNLIFEISEKLDKFHTKRGVKSFQFSFITKMMNTINNESPIWDSEVKKMFRFKNIPNNTKFTLQQRIEFAVDQLKYMKYTFKSIQESKELDSIIEEFDLKYETSDLSFNKKIDFILWSAGKVLDK